MKKFVKFVKIAFLKRNYIRKLYENLVFPQDVRDHLVLLSNSSRLLSIILKKDIEEFDRVVEEDYKRYLESQIDSQEHQGGCFDCPWGNGEGGCTVPCCPGEWQN